VGTQASAGSARHLVVGGTRAGGRWAASRATEGWLPTAAACCAIADKRKLSLLCKRRVLYPCVCPMLSPTVRGLVGRQRREGELLRQLRRDASVVAWCVRTVRARVCCTRHTHTHCDASAHYVIYLQMRCYILCRTGEERWHALCARRQTTHTTQTHARILHRGRNAEGQCAVEGEVCAVHSGRQAGRLSWECTHANTHALRIILRARTCKHAAA